MMPRLKRQRKIKRKPKKEIETAKEEHKAADKAHEEASKKEDAAEEKVEKAEEEVAEAKEDHIEVREDAGLPTNEKKKPCKKFSCDPYVDKDVRKQLKKNAEAMKSSAKTIASQAVLLIVALMYLI